MMSTELTVYYNGSCPLCRRFRVADHLWRATLRWWPEQENRA